MEYVYAALLLHSSGKDVNEEGIKTILDATGVEVDDVRIKALVSALEGVDIENVLSQVPSTAAAPVAAAPAATVAEAPVAEEEEEEEAEESGIEGLGALFG